jgi:PAS domain S-box-containing protein
LAGLDTRRLTNGTSRYTHSSAENVSNRLACLNLSPKRGRLVRSAQERLAFLAAIVESSDDAIIGQDLNGLITSWNAAAGRMYGYRGDEAIGQPVSLILPAEGGDALARIMARVESGGRVSHFQTVCTRRDGQRLDVSISVSPIQNAAGRMIGSAMIARDITDHKRVERANFDFHQAQAAREQAEASVRRFRLLAEASVVLEATFDAEAALSSVTRLVVRSLADWCVIDIVSESGRTSRVGSSFPACVTPTLLRELRGRDQRGRAHARGVARLVDPQRRGADSQIQSLARFGLGSMMIVPLQVRGQLLGNLSMGKRAASERQYGVVDLTFAEDLGRRCALALENARLYRAAQRAVAARDEFLAATSHELRTPLSHVKGFVSTLRRTDMEFDEETRADFLAEVEREADRLAELIGDLLEWSRVATHGPEMDRRSLASLAGLVAGGLDRVRGALGERQLLIEVPESLPEICVDASQIERVVANLVDNAVKYSPPGTRIRIAGFCDADDVVLRVEDEGLGIPEDHLARVFEPFFRDTGGGWPAKPGTGLGLAVCRSIVHAHGGQIRAENLPGRGAALVISLPVAHG